MFKIIYSLFLSSSLAFAGGGVDTGGGGDGIVRGNNILLQDLVEAGVELDIPLPQTPSVLFEEPLSHSKWIDEETLSFLGAKLDVLSKVDAAFAAALVKTIRFYSWSFVSGDLVELPDTDSVVHQSLVQVAIRKPSMVYLSKLAWNKMPPYHRAALVLHEAAAALLNSEAPAIRTRQLVGELFSLSSDQTLSAAQKQNIQMIWPSATTLRSLATAHANDLNLAVVLRQPKGWDVMAYPSVEVMSVAPNSATTSFQMFLSPRSKWALTEYLCDRNQPVTATHKAAAYYYDELSVVLEPLAEENLPKVKVQLDHVRLKQVPLTANGGCRPQDLSELLWIRNLFVD